MRRLILPPAWLWLLLFIAAPAGLLLVIALARPADGVPPYAPALSGASFSALIDPYYGTAFLGSLRIGCGDVALLPVDRLSHGLPLRAPRRRGGMYFFCS